VCQPSFFRVVWQPRLCVNLGSCGCLSTLDPIPFFNELFFRLGILGSTHLVTRLLK
jgi:hypothetical protein